MSNIYNWPMGQHKVEDFARFVRFNGGHVSVSKVKRYGSKEFVNVYFESALPKEDLLDYLKSI